MRMSRQTHSRTQRGPAHRCHRGTVKWARKDKVAVLQSKWEGWYKMPSRTEAKHTEVCLRNHCRLFSQKET